MNYFGLYQTSEDVLKKIEEAEKKGEFNEHLDPIDYDYCYPVDESFQYITHGARRLHDAWQRFWIVRPFCAIMNHSYLKTEVHGREHLKGIQNAIVTCNHVNKMDAVAVRKACSGHGFRVTVGDFNNQKGSLGDFMRTFGIMPFSNDLKAMKRFNKAVHYLLRHGNYVLFFPERAEWWCYEKPRPYMDGAYHYAVRNHVPVVPMFITFTKLGKNDPNGIERRKFHVHILEPIYADPNLSDHENMKLMLEKNFELCKQKYEEFYGRELTYDCPEELSPLKSGVVS